MIDIDKLYNINDDYLFDTNNYIGYKIERDINNNIIGYTPGFKIMIVNNRLDTILYMAVPAGIIRKAYNIIGGKIR